MVSGCYVYAILARESALPADLTGFDGAELLIVPHRAVAALVSCLDPSEVRQTPEHLLHHEAVVEAVCQRGPALPVRFGSILADPTAVTRALAERYPVLLADLARLSDKVEFGLSVLWETERIRCEVAHLTERPPTRKGDPGPDLRPDVWHPAPDKAGPGTHYLLARLAEYRRDTLLRSEARALVRELDRALHLHALESCGAVLPTPRLALSRSYLVEIARAGDFREAFERTRDSRPDLRFLLSGPWPPYSFVTPTCAPTANPQLREE